LVAPNPVDGPVPGRGYEPGRGVGRGPVPRPALGRGGEGLLRGLLGEIELAEEADQGGQDAAPLLAEDSFEGQ
jgi:hypothetical protein